MLNSDNEMPAEIESNKKGPRSQLGLYRSYLTSPEHRRYITVGRESILADTIAILRENIGKKPKHHQLFIAPRGSGKTHFLSLIEDEIHEDASLKHAYQVVRFPEEANRVCSFADFLLTICEVMQNNDSVEEDDSPWKSLYEKLSTDDDDGKIADILGRAIRDEYRKSKRVFVLMVENLNQILEKQMKSMKSVQALRGFLMGDNGCLLIGTSPMHFGSLTKADQPFYDFFDIQVLDLLTSEDTISLIRKNLEWDKREDLLQNFNGLRPKLRAIHTLTGGNPRLAVMLYELITTESIINVKEQFLKLMDFITPFYQDRMRDLSPQERSVLETIASMRDKVGQLALPKTPGNIAKYMRMGQQQVSSLLARLTKALYLVSFPNPEDARSTIYTIREGFFDLWIAMNQSRSLQQRIPLLSDFFTAFYEQDEARQQKRAEYWQKLDAGEFDADAAENLSYLSTVGKTDEQASEKFKLIPKVLKAGDHESGSLLKRELSLLPIDPTGQWIFDRMNRTEINYLDEISQLIECWETKRQGGLEAFVQSLLELGNQLNYNNWSELKVQFLESQVESIPLSDEKIILRSKLMSFFSETARWDEAELQGKIALSEAESLKIDHIVSITYHNYALVLMNLNRINEAETIINKAIQIDKNNFGENHPETAADLINLSQLYISTNRLDEAESLLIRALSINEEYFGEENENVLVSINNLAQLYLHTKKFVAAEPLINRALKISDQIYGTEHPNYATLLNNLAKLYFDTKRLSEAEFTLRRALNIDEACYGKNHHLVANKLNGLSQILQRSGKLDEAETLLKRALEIDKSNYDEDHPNIARDLNNLALLLKRRGRFEEAKMLMDQQMHILIRYYQNTGFSHLYLSSAIKNYTSLIITQGFSADEAQEKITSLFHQYNVPLPPDLFNEK
jgi:tetratricopeptide (TPR) repeat protein